MSNELKELQAARDAAQRLRDKAAQLAKDYTDTQKERASVAMALLPQAECIAAARALVDAQHQQWQRQHGRGLVAAVVGAPRYDGTTVTRTKPRLPQWAPVNQGGLELADLCGLVPDMVKAALESAIKGAGVEHGLAEPARTKELARLDSLLASIEQAHTTTVDGAAQFGIVDIPLLPHVAAQRAADAARAQDATMGVPRGIVGQA